jgi:hypothetical protein
MVHHKSFTLALVAILVLVTPGSTFGDEYCKWTDENGAVHYGEKCPDNVISTIVVAEDKRTESQIRAAEELAKSVQSGLAKPTKSLGEPKKPESGNRAEVTAYPTPQDTRDLSQMSVEELDALCEKEREKRLAPEREQLIKQCVTDWRSSQEYCEGYYADHGDVIRIDEDHVRPALYMDLPECVAAWDARMKGK